MTFLGIDRTLHPSLDEINFLQAGTGAVQRDAQSKMRDIVSVKDFGAVGDGVTDDTAAIQAALSSGLRCVMIPVGTFLISSALILPSGVSLIGQGCSTIKLKNNAAPIPTSLVTTNTTNNARGSNVALVGLIFDANRENNIDHGTPDGAGNQAQGWNGTLLAVVALAYMDGVRVENCIVKNSFGSGIWFVDCTDVLAAGNTVTACRKSGISARRFAPIQSPGMRDYRFVNNYVSGGVVGIHGIFGTRNGTISGNICTDQRDSNAFPAFAYSGTYPNIWPSTGGFTAFGEGGYVSPANEGDGAGIELTGYYTATSAATEADILIAGNVCTDCVVGIRAEQAAERISVSANVCTDNDKYGLFLYSATDVVAAGNYIALNREHGVAVSHASGQIAPAYILLVGNNIARNNQFGVVFENTDSSVIRDNLVVANGVDTGVTQRGAFGLYQDDITSAFCNAVVIANNFVDQTGGYWVFYDNTGHSNVSLVNNAFFGTPTSNLNNVNLTNTVVRGNTGLVTRNTGSATVSNNSFVTITHGLAFTPLVANIRINPVEDIAADGRFYVGPVPTATTFDVIYAGGSAPVAIAWAVDDQ